MIVVWFRYLLEALLNPFLICLILFTLSLLWLCFRRDNRIVRGGLLLSLLGLILFSTRWLPDLLITQLENQYVVVTTANPAISWIVVLGGGHSDKGGVPANDELSSASIVRLVEGVRLYRQLPKATLLLSGGSGYVGKTSEAAYLAILASWFAIPANKLVLETDSINTADEAVAIKKMVHDDFFYLVTSAIHMPRAMALCKQQGLHPVAAPTDFSYNNGRSMYLPNFHNLAHTNAALHEILGLYWARMRGEA